MKKICLLMVLLILSISLLVGCSSNQNFRDRQGMGFDREFNLTEEERQQMFEERQQQAINSCQGKNEGDSCTFNGPTEDVDGICKTMDENLVCAIDRPMGER